MLLACSAMFGAGFVSQAVKAAILDKTVKSTEGPYYPKKSMRPNDVDNDLVKIEGTVKLAGGEVIILKGRVKDQNGVPQKALRVEIWQCDVNGKYLHTGDSQQIIHDKGFQGFGHDITDSNGEYRFRCIKPSKYPGRTPHIHVKVCKGEEELLTTQFYIKDEAENARDSIFRRLSDKQADAVSMQFVEGAEGPEASVDIVV